jgi:succinate dehydrogenase/fumarate reductase flavoprotein subunit
MSADKKLSRRNFLRGAAVAAPAAAAVGALASAAPAMAADSQSHWHKDADVVVVGTGFAGLAAAITAAEAGAKVIIIEKAPQQFEGGNSKVSGNMWWAPKEGQVDGALTYAKAMGYGTASDECLAALVNEMTGLNAWILAKAGIEAKPYNLKFCPEHPELPGSSSEQSYNTGQSGTGKLYYPLRAYVANLGIEVMYETPAQELVQGPIGVVRGVLASQNGKAFFLKARKGVILACGGFEFDFEMQKNFLPGWPIYGRGTPYNTGDGIKMCQRIGAPIWHMANSLAGFGALLLPTNMPGTDIPWITNMTMPATASSFVMLDKNGKRFMNEKNEDRHGFGQKEYQLFFEGLANADFTRIPWWTVFDANSMNKGSLLYYPPNKSTDPTIFTWFMAHSGMTWSPDNHEAIDNGWILSAGSIEELVGKMQAAQAASQARDHSAFPFTDHSTLSVESVQAAIDKYNGYCASGAGDPDFGRPAAGMAPISTGPFYAMQNYPVTYNTLGGPKRNGKCQIVDMDNRPIPHLYSAGEIGSFWGWMYNGGGNISECICTGIMAARNAVAERGWG